MKTSSATMPTKIAAIHSIESMKRSMYLVHVAAFPPPRAARIYTAAPACDNGGEDSPPPS